MHTRTLPLLAAFALALLLPAPTAAQVFDPADSFSPTAGDDLFVADFNKDGRADVVTNQAYSNTLNIFLNYNGLLGPSAPTSQYMAGPPSYTRRVVAADFDGDGDADIVAANCNTDSSSYAPGGHIAWLPNNGNGTFAEGAWRHTPELLCPNSLGIIYLPGDTRPDLVITTETASNPAAAKIYLMRNVAPAGQWFESAGSLSVSDAVENFGASAADFDKDGLADVAVVSKLSSGHTCVDLLFPNTTKATRRVSCPTGAKAANTVDLLNDGAPDLLIPFTGGRGLAGVNALWNGGTGRFTSRDLNLGGTFSDVGWKASEADFNLDGLDDIVTTTLRDPLDGMDGFAIFLATGTGFWGQTYFRTLNVTIRPPGPQPPRILIPTARPTSPSPAAVRRG